MDDIRGRLGKLESDCKIKFAELNEYEYERFEGT